MASLIQKQDLELKRGVYTSVCVNHSQIELLDRHIARISAHSRMIGIQPPFIDIALLLNLVKTIYVPHRQYKLKIFIFERDQERFSHRGEYRVYIDPYSRSYPSSVRLCLYSEPQHNQLRQIKRWPHFSYKKARQWALNKGFDDCVFVDADQNLLETSIANLFWIEGRSIYTPSGCLPLMKGIMLSLIEECCLEMEIRIKEGAYALQDIPAGAQVFVCNSLFQCIPVEMIEERKFMIGKQKLLFDTLLKRKIERFSVRL